MRTHRTIAVSVLSALIVGATSCYDNDDARAQERGTGSTTVREEAKETWDELKAYAVDRRTEFERIVDERLDRMERETDELFASLASRTDVDELRTKADGLKQRARDLRTRLDELRAAGEDLWDDTRDEIVDEARDLQASLERLRDDLRS